ncbi:MAG: YmL10 [Peltula sp. TS41687]|nr:MAG: YmL10 [Peltula sp. TS41687]
MGVTTELLRAGCSLKSSFTSSPLPGPRLFYRQQYRCASILASLSDNPSAYNRRIRRGRGPSSGKGKTSGRGHKGQKQHGKVPAGFQGGQTPLEVVKGKRGFENIHTPEMSPVNLDRVQSWIDQGRIDPSRPITVKELVKSRCIHGVKDGVKLLARGAGELKAPVNILVSRASAAAISAVEAAGGSIMTRYYTNASIRRILRGESDAYIPTPGIQLSSGDPHKPFKHRLPDPTSRRDIEYYRDPAHRGYLSHLVQEGEGPSLFFKVPKQKEANEKRSIARTSQAEQRAENRIW